jgi:branched-chain amino acid transport system substrate-binding protein
MVMDDPNDRDNPLVRALREDPLPERPYQAGRFGERVRRGDVVLVGRRSVPTGGRGRTPTLRLAGVLSLAACVIGAFVILQGRPPSTTGASPSPAASTGMSPSALASLGPILRIGISLPLSTDVNGGPNAVRDGALLAIADANARGFIPGVTIESVILDHSSPTPGGNDLPKAVEDMRSLILDSTIVGVVGPFQSYVAQGQIPLSNAAGLIQCTPSASNPDLTKGPNGQQLRVSRPNDVAFLRLGPTDDDVGPGLADFAFNTLHARRAFVVDDGADYGIPLADAFTARFQNDGGSVVLRETTAEDATDYAKVLAAGAALHPDVVLFGGVTAYGGNGAAGAGAFRRQMATAGLADVPLLGGDGLKDTDQDGKSLIALAGPAAAGTYSADLVPANYPGKAAFDTAFQRAYGRVAPPYAGPGYACAQVILQAIATAAANGSFTRAGVRASAADTATTFATVLGSIRFDAAGDVTSPSITMDTVDLKGNGGAGGWVVVGGPSPTP